MSTAANSDPIPLHPDRSQKISPRERTALRAVVKDRLSRNPNTSGADLFRELSPPITYGTFIAAYVNPLMDELGIPRRDTPKKEPKKETKPETIAYTSRDETGLGAWRARPNGDGTFSIQAELLNVDRKTFLTLRAQFFSLLYPDAESTL